MPNLNIGAMDAEAFLGKTITCDWGLLLKSGKLPGTSGLLSMSTLPVNGIQLTYDAPPAMPEIKLTMTGIELVCAKILKITMAALPVPGITLEAGPTSSIQITPAGVTIKGLMINNSP